ncbi:MAG: M3 family metallopeptidase [Chitinophagales bacterium]|nr:M3 family metallopeptidase [Chitinophagales bacterium]
MQDEDKLDELFNKLIKLRHQIALNAGFKNYRDYMFEAKHRFDYTVKDCKDFHESVAENIVPIVKALDQEKCKQLGFEKMRPWDTDVDPLNREPLSPFNGTAEFIAKAIACLNTLDGYFGACINEMNEMGRLDLESRKGKAPGGGIIWVCRKQAVPLFL